MLRSNDLVWSYRLLNHLLGERVPMTDLMAWNADGTRLPYRMHSEYLRALFLDNALARGDFMLDGAPVNLHDIRVPVFNVATVQDHVAPWRSVFKLHRLCRRPDLRAHCRRPQRGHRQPAGQSEGELPHRGVAPHRPPATSDEWLAENAPVEGSWWTAGPIGCDAIRPRAPRRRRWARPTPGCRRCRPRRARTCTSAEAAERRGGADATTAPHMGVCKSVSECNTVLAAQDLRLGNGECGREGVTRPSSTLLPSVFLPLYERIAHGTHHVAPYC